MFKKKFLSILFIFFILIAVSSCGKKDYEPGVYEGSGKGWNLDKEIKLSITIDKDKKLSDITILSSDETPSIGGKALNDLIEDALNRQDGDVDIISEASLTSQGFKEALNKALDKARE